MVLVEHDMGMVMDLADRVMALDFGIPIATGSPAEIQSDAAGHRGLPGRVMTATTTAAPPDRSGDLAGPTLPHILLARAAASPESVAMRKKHLGVWRPYGWREYADRAAAVAAGLRALGVEPGDKVAIQSENRPAWLLCDLAVQGLGGVSVGVYPTSPAAEVEYLLEHSESVVLIAEDEEQVDKALAVRARTSRLRKIVVIDPRGVTMADDQLMTFAELEALGRSSSTDPVADLAASVDAIDPSGTAIIVYTSGTTGPPKGAMLSHHNLLAAARSSREVFDVSERDEVLSTCPCAMWPSGSSPGSTPWPRATS